MDIEAVEAEYKQCQDALSRIGAIQLRASWLEGFKAGYNDTLASLQALYDASQEQAAQEEAAPAA